MAQLGHLTPRLAPTEKATTTDFHWAAGFFEGEGYAGRSGRRPQGTRARIGQKDPWTLYRMKALFGGSINPLGHRPPCTSWDVSGARARGFLMSIYGLLSPRRQEQIRKALAPGS